MYEKLMKTVNDFECDIDCMADESKLKKKNPITTFTLK